MEETRMKRPDTDDISGWPVGHRDWLVKAEGNKLMFFCIKSIDRDGNIEAIGFRNFGGNNGYLGGARYFLMPDNSHLRINREQVPDPILYLCDREFAND